MKTTAWVGKAALVAIGQLWHTLRAILREIFDEAAYERFQQRNPGQNARKSYAAFRQERESGQARRPRCC